MRKNSQTEGTSVLVMATWQKSKTIMTNHKLLWRSAHVTCDLSQTVTALKSQSANCSVANVTYNATAEKQMLVQQLLNNWIMSTNLCHRLQPKFEWWLVQNGEHSRRLFTNMFTLKHFLYSTFKARCCFRCEWGTLRKMADISYSHLNVDPCR